MPGRAAPRGRGLAHGTGLPEVRAGDWLALGSGGIAQAKHLMADGVKLVLYDPLEQTTDARVMEAPLLPAGEDIRGRVLDALGRPLDGGEEPVRTVSDRLVKVDPFTFPRRQLHTGIKALDLFLPIFAGAEVQLDGPMNTGQRPLINSMLRGHVGSGGRGILVVPALSRDYNLSGMLRAGVTVIAARQDAPPALRARTLRTAAVIGSAWRRQGAEVLLIVDCLEAHFQAEAEVAASLGLPLCRDGRALSSDAALSEVFSQVIRARDSSLGLVVLHRGVAPGLRHNMHLKTSPALAKQGRFPALDVFGENGRFVANSKFDGRHIPRLMRGRIGFMRCSALWGADIEQQLRHGLERAPWCEPWLWYIQAVRRLIEQPADRSVSTREQCALVCGWRGILNTLPPEQVPTWEAALLSRLDDSIPVDVGSAKGLTEPDPALQALTDAVAAELLD